VPSRLKRYQRFGSDHFITFSCYRRLALLNSDYACRTFEHVLEDVRRWYDLYVFGYVIMPDHVHLLVSEPREGDLRTAIQMLKQLVARRSKSGKKETRFWQARYYDFNVTTRRKWVEKLRYIHRNPVTRGLVSAPEEWKWSSYRHWLTGKKGTVEIESHWTFDEREKMGVNPRFTRRPNEDGPSDPTLTPKEG
jgi:putative transposase